MHMFLINLRYVKVFTFHKFSFIFFKCKVRGPRAYFPVSPFLFLPIWGKQACICDEWKSKLTRVWGTRRQNTGTRKDSAFGGVCAWSLPTLSRGHAQLRKVPKLSTAAASLAPPDASIFRNAKLKHLGNLLPCEIHGSGTGEMLMTTREVAQSSKMKLERGSDLKGEWVLGGSASFFVFAFYGWI